RRSSRRWKRRPRRSRSGRRPRLRAPRGWLLERGRGCLYRKTRSPVVNPRDLDQGFERGRVATSRHHEQPNVPREKGADDRTGHERRDVRRMFWREHEAETGRNQVLQMPELTATVSNLRLDPRREEAAPQVARALASGAFDPDGLLQNI